MSDFRKLFLAAFAAILMFWAPQTASAGFVDNFELNPNAGDVGGLDGSNTIWVVTPTLDVAGPMYGGLSCHSGTSCIDMDGTGQMAGSLKTMFATMVGATYTANFWIGGSQRNFLGPDAVTVNFGTAIPLVVTTPQGDTSWTMYTMSFVGDGNNHWLEFVGQGADNVGVLLDDVELADNSVPEPATFALIGGGLVLLGLKRRGRKNANN